MMCIYTIVFAFQPLSVGEVGIEPILVPPCQVDNEELIDIHICETALKYDVDEQLARNIMWCESKQYEHKAINENKRDDGSVWSLDIGRWQINDYWHEETMQSMGMDIYDDYDNIEYGFQLLANEGVKHWKASRHCWSLL